MRKRGLMSVMLLVGAILACQQIPVQATDNQQVASLVVATPEVQDSTLNDRVETLLRTDIGLAGSQFRSQTKGGIVSLSGRVPDEHALRRALDLASSVKGVREVRNSMVVDFPK
ncbi:MAG: BON domain-containing protein [Rhodocyclales bacterium GT-UBC]|nr:MAG: BON domain-containing protein [Rhodocyclales bacterium GT-UBC]